MKACSHGKKKNLINEVRSVGLSHKSLAVDAWSIISGVPVSVQYKICPAMSRTQIQTTDPNHCSESGSLQAPNLQNQGGIPQPGEETPERCRQ